MEYLRQQKREDSYPGWGKVASVSDDTVILEGGIEAVKCCDCSVGDIVAIEAVKGTLRAIGRKGGDASHLPLSGGTVTGAVDFLATPTVQDVVNARYFTKNTAADNSATDTANRYSGLYNYDKNDKLFAYLESSRRADGASWSIWAARSATSGTQVDNQVSLRVLPDGTRQVVVSEAYPWQSALMGVGRELPSGYNFNGATFPGVYYTGSSTVSASCPNCPITDQGVMLKVERSIGSNVVTQTVRGWADGKTYTRGINGSTVYPWQMNGGYSAIEASHLDATWGNWNWIKWSDGNAMCWKYVYTSWTLNSAWGNLYISASCPSQAYPFTFTWSPGFIAMPVNWNANYSVWPVYNYNGSTTVTPTWFYARAGSYGTAINFNSVIFAWGRWK